MYHRYKIVLKTIFWRAVVAALLLALVVLLVLWCAHEPKIPAQPMARLDIEHAIRSGAVIIIADARSHEPLNPEDPKRAVIYTLDVKDSLMGQAGRRIRAVRYDNPEEFRLIDDVRYLLLLNVTQIDGAIEYSLHRFEKMDERRAYEIREWIAEFRPSRMQPPPEPQ